MRPLPPLPCIGSHTQTTAAPLAVTFSTSGGVPAEIRRAPIRVVRVRRPGSRSGRGALDQLEHVLRAGVRSDLDGDGIADLAGELDVGAVGIAGALPDPQQVSRQVSRYARSARRSGQGAHSQQQGLVAGVELHRAELPRVSPARVHERDRPVNLARQLLVALPGQALRPRSPGSRRAPGAGRHSRRWRATGTGSACPAHNDRPRAVAGSGVLAAAVGSMPLTASPGRPGVPRPRGPRWPLTAACRTGRPSGRPSPPARWPRTSARPPSAAASGTCRGCCRRSS